LANILNNTPGIRKVLYPGLENHPTYPEAVRLFGEKGFGAIITFDFDGNGDTEKRSRRDRFIEAVSDKIKIIPSLGDSNTILLPVESVWGEKYPEPGMIRLSVGVEDYPELESTILNGLGR
jgi:cystathionine beta-lyase/cystathionine gamma-synthase